MRPGLLKWLIRLRLTQISCLVARRLRFESTEEYSIVKVDVAWAGLSETFVTKNRPAKNESVVMDLVEGPFKYLSGKWTFVPIGNDGCKVVLELTYEFDGLANLASPLMKKSFDQIVRAFEREIEFEQN